MSTMTVCQVPAEDLLPKTVAFQLRSTHAEEETATLERAILKLREPWPERHYWLVRLRPDIDWPNFKEWNHFVRRAYEVLDEHALPDETFQITEGNDRGQFYIIIARHRVATRPPA